MATYTKSPASTWAHSDNATFREWGKAISDGLAAVGLVKTADTGNDSNAIGLIDWSTATRPGTSTDAGYEIWRFDDAVQAGAPVFLKVRYGTAGSATFARLQVDIGQGSDGSGNLTGSHVQSTAIDLSGAAALGQSTPIRMSGGEGWVALDWLNGSSGRIFRFAIERFRDADGTPSTRGLYVMRVGSTTAAAVYVLTSSGWVNTETTVPIGWPSTDSSRPFTSGSTVYAAPCIPWSGESDGVHGTPYERTLAFMAAASGVAGGGSSLSVARWDGDSHTYIGTGSAYADSRMASTATYALMLWE